EDEQQRGRDVQVDDRHAQALEEIFHGEEVHHHPGGDGEEADVINDVNRAGGHAKPIGVGGREIEQTEDDGEEAERPTEIPGALQQLVAEVLVDGLEAV